MLRLVDITKVYPVKDNPVYALKGISLNFRKNEFVSILGPSGCGKTTTLNIIGGLDHYTDGDLIINGVSTKRYDDHDWDVYRNHKIGFIFQSYNLIPHENILENVELALTIAGLGKEERTRRAKEALDNVGLKGMYYKHPNQLSGGQCQRVAIARALVNEPDILLADEPTGALDSQTSIQIMDLVKKISKEKLVIMVTHNPDLAQKYSTRIIELLDGEVKSDSNPYSVEEEEAERVTPQATIVDEKAKMSWWTAFKLSAKNLWSKIRRTSLIVVASSIGIVGVSAVLAVSQGVRGYIVDMQDDMLSGNPIEVAESGLSLTSLMNAAGSMGQTEAVIHSVKDGKIDIQFLMEALIKTSDTLDGAMVSNTITPEYEAFIDDMPSDYYAALAKDYGVNVKNNIYTDCEMDIKNWDPDNRYSISCITTVCSNILEVMEDGKYKDYSPMVDQYTNTIGQCLDNKEYVLEQYDVLEGHYPTEENEMMLVLNSKKTVPEFVLTLLGFYSQEEFANAAYHFSHSDKFDPDLWETQQSITFDEILNKKYYYYPNNTIYEKNPAYGGSATEDDTCYQPYFYSYQEDPSWDEGMELRIVGILAPKETTFYGCMSAGLYYTPKLADRMMADNAQSDVTRFVRNFEEDNGNNGYSSMIIKQTVSSLSVRMISGFGYRFNFFFEDDPYVGYGVVGSQNGLSSFLASMGGGSSGGSGGSSSGSGLSIEKTATITTRDLGGATTPANIYIYPKNFDTKYMVTDYLSQWGKGDITLSDGTVIRIEDQTEIDYTDNLEVVITMINGVIDIVTIALVCFTALSLVVSTVMIGIITYVSVMERVKEIGVIRSLGGRKKDVSHLFNAETFMIGAASGLFGLAITYLFELILNLTIGRTFNLGMIANLNWYTAIIVFLISILLTMVAGLIPSLAAAKQDPVNALRSE
ncbi:MAG: ABC transporter ATP-binding protein/permease [Candidatus Enteromonas sp.]|nr:ABC transporter ATP-binding protein/permease [Candidatus Enteromonas sp.]